MEDIAMGGKYIGSNYMWMIYLYGQYIYAYMHIDVWIGWVLPFYLVIYFLTFVKLILIPSELKCIIFSTLGQNKLITILTNYSRQESNWKKMQSILVR